MGLALALMLTHRFYARPWARRRAVHRCLWCGGSAPEGPLVVIQEPRELTTWRCCRGYHGLDLRATLDRAWRLRTWLRVTIFTGIGVVVALPLAGAFGAWEGFQAADAVAAFRLLVALAVLPLAWPGTRRGPMPEKPLPSPFPVHIQALIGSRAVLWLFRLVGVLWLGLGLLHVAKRSGIV
ncbi:MAG: hypothetical protein Q9Q13_06940 [Acidobacteriota bacterium]|nr:hypothetical protein [Acidobacteriota bacterium]